MEFTSHQYRPGSQDHNNQSSYWNRCSRKYTEPFVIVLAVILSFSFVVPAVTLGVLHRVSPGVASAMAMPCPVLLLAIGGYVKWRLQAMKRARHMHDLEPMPVQAFSQMRPTVIPLQSASPHVNTVIASDDGGESKTREMLSQAALFHDDHADETGPLLTNEQQ